MTPDKIVMLIVIVFFGAIITYGVVGIIRDKIAWRREREEREARRATRNRRQGVQQIERRICVRCERKSDMGRRTDQGEWICEDCAEHAGRVVAGALAKGVRG